METMTLGMTSAVSKNMVPLDPLLRNGDLWISLIPGRKTTSESPKTGLVSVGTPREADVSGHFGRDGGRGDPWVPFLGAERRCFGFNYHRTSSIYETLNFQDIPEEVISCFIGGIPKIGVFGWSQGRILRNPRASSKRSNAVVLFPPSTHGDLLRVGFTTRSLQKRVL